MKDPPEITPRTSRSFEDHHVQPESLEPNTSLQREQHTTHLDTCGLRSSPLLLRGHIHSPANCTMQPNAGPSRDDNRQKSTSTPRYGPIFTPAGGQVQAQQQQQQQQYPARREGLAPIAPAPEGSSSRSGTSGTPSASNMTPSGIAATRDIPARPKRKLINLACTACQKRKSKVRD